MSLRGRNAVITGATRGIGRGIAIGFGELGANVYITGRTEKSLKEVAQLVRDAGGNCEYFIVDHSADLEVSQLFEKLKARLSADGSKLHVLVNNAYAAVPFLQDSMDIPFWRKDAENPAEPNVNAEPGKVWDLVNGVGLRNNFVCATHAMRMMEPQAEGLIVNITSWGGIVSVFDVTYSIGKEAVERMSAEIALAAPEGIYSIAFCPGFVTTESLKEIAEDVAKKAAEEGSTNGSLPLWNAETPLFVGRVLAALVSEKGSSLLPKMNGKVVIASEAAEYVGINDENDFRPLSFRSARFGLMSSVPFLRTSPLRYLIPRTLYAPWTIVKSLKETRRFWN